MLTAPTLTWAKCFPAPAPPPPRPRLFRRRWPAEGLPSLRDEVPDGDRVDLKALFEPHGTVNSATIMKELDGMPKGGFVSMDDAAGRRGRGACRRDGAGAGRRREEMKV